MDNCAKSEFTLKPELAKIIKPPINAQEVTNSANPTVENA